MPPFAERALEWSERVLPEVWADRVSRWCLLGGVAFLWLAVSLGVPLLVLPTIGAGFGLWKRREQRAAATDELSDPDFL